MLTTANDTITLAQYTLHSFAFWSRQLLAAIGRKRRAVHGIGRLQLTQAHQRTVQLSQQVAPPVIILRSPRLAEQVGGGIHSLGLVSARAFVQSSRRADRCPTARLLAGRLHVVSAYLQFEFCPLPP